MKNKKTILILSIFLVVVFLSSSISLVNAFIIEENPEVYSEDLKGYWSFDNKTFQAVDDSEYGNDGTLDGGSYTDGKEGNAIRLDGKNDYIGVEDSNSLNDFDKFTIVSWVKFNDLKHNSYQTIISKSGNDPAKTKGWLLDIDIGWKLTLWIYTTGWEYVEYDIATSDLEEGKWVHLAGVYDKDELKIYIDGDKVADKEEVGKLRNSKEDLLIGADFGHSPEGFFNGTLDEVAVFDEALTGDEIESIKKDGIRPVVPANISINWVDVLILVVPIAIAGVIIILVVRKYRFKAIKRKTRRRSKK